MSQAYLKFEHDGESYELCFQHERPDTWKAITTEEYIGENLSPRKLSYALKTWDGTLTSFYGPAHEKRAREYAAFMNRQELKRGRRRTYGTLYKVVAERVFTSHPLAENPVVTHTTRELVAQATATYNPADEGTIPYSRATGRWQAYRNLAKGLLRRQYQGTGAFSDLVYDMARAWVAQENKKQLDRQARRAAKKAARLIPVQASDPGPQNVPIQTRFFPPHIGHLGSHSPNLCLGTPSRLFDTDAVREAKKDAEEADKRFWAGLKTPAPAANTAPPSVSAGQMGTQTTPNAADVLVALLNALLGDVA